MREEFYKISIVDTLDTIRLQSKSNPPPQIFNYATVAPYCRRPSDRHVSTASELHWTSQYLRIVLEFSPKSSADSVRWNSSTSIDEQSSETTPVGGVHAQVDYDAQRCHLTAVERSVDDLTHQRTVVADIRRPLGDERQEPFDEIDVVLLHDVV